ncbi:uncharacterized protein LOC124456417 isoform X2 [Xenia sp. Carnegie-2017]|uniref:uncharacterized protein LOC124456417 isoform X2 n=1 Tax=Xenia sp. Carnegie-2017 TaxID=2897299 RepID=UPI001F041833|nr:uncharacterized protein LOC124456417 isoform X2 [Xenia sp. Carnegie-2017]
MNRPDKYNALTPKFCQRHKRRIMFTKLKATCCKVKIRSLKFDEEAIINEIESDVAMSVVLCNTKLDCDMAKERGIVAEFIFQKVSMQCLRDRKKLMVSGNIQELEDKNHEECDLFHKYISNDDIVDGIVRRWWTSLQE